MKPHPTHVILDDAWRCAVCGTLLASLDIGLRCVSPDDGYETTYATRSDGAQPPEYWCVCASTATMLELFPDGHERCAGCGKAKAS